MTDWSHEDMLGAARAIRPYLTALVDDYEPRDAEIAGLLHKAGAGIEVELELVDALTATDALRQWTEQFLKAQRPPQVTPTRSIVDLALSGPVDVERWICPHGDFDWFRFAPGERVRPCPTHGISLVLAPAKSAGAC